MKRFFCVLCLLMMPWVLSSCTSTQNIGDKNSVYGSIEELYYNYDNASFAKLTVTSIKKNIYCNKSSEEFHYILLDCIIEEDYYDKLDNATTVILPISLNKSINSYYDETTLISWFEENNNILAYFKEADERSALKEIESNEICYLDNYYYPCSLEQLDIIPICDDCVNFDTLYSLINMDDIGNYHYLITDYTTYIENDMNFEIVAENIRNLSKNK